MVILPFLVFLSTPKVCTAPVCSCFGVLSGQTLAAVGLRSVSALQRVPVRMDTYLIGVSEQHSATCSQLHKTTEGAELLQAMSTHFRSSTHSAPLGCFQMAQRRAFRKKKKKCRWQHCVYRHSPYCEMLYIVIVTLNRWNRSFCYLK